ncbi:MAG: glycoside hydrolase family 68 protein [Sphingomonas sp.]|nr:glycoside hydrolase family 68 protein [Sphingomonas sp.]
MQVEAIGSQTPAGAPLIGEGDFKRIADDLDVWDAWPVQQRDGHPAALEDGTTLWMALGAPRFPDPDERHGHARIHLLARRGEDWRHLGPAMPDGFSPGSREWSGSAVLEPDGTTLTLYFTATGRRGEPTLTFEQRLYRAIATLDRESDKSPRLCHWRDLQEIVVRDPVLYMASDAGAAEVGRIKAFRDPAYFLDPASGAQYLLFAASLAGSSSEFNGVIGAAIAGDVEGKEWRILPPLVSADTLNNELERPHMLQRDGLYYLFWSTQRHVFNPEGPMGPTGLYGMVSERIDRGWRPINGTGLVFANPPEAPKQAYSWLVLPDLSVTSFVDEWGAGESYSGPRRFGASFAPMLRLVLSGDGAWLDLRA